MERGDIQRLVIHEYRRAAAFLFLEIAPGGAAGARAWLKDDILPHVASVELDRERALQVAFTAAGLRALGLEESELQTFPQDFLEGMARRAEQLGDRVEDAGRWQLGRDGQDLHVLLAVYADTPEDVERTLDALRGPRGEALSSRGLRVVHLQRAAWSEREPFGFREGLSQPAIAQFPETHGPRLHPDDAPVETGELLLGYRNEYGELPTSPQVRPERDPKRHLKPTAAGGALRDLGRNGTFLVVRKLRQDVERFQAFLAEQAQRVWGVDDERHRKLLAAKLIGRWQNGAPLEEGQTEEPELRPGEENAFLFLSPRGQGCPVGAHIRRANPRDSLPSSGKLSEGEPEAAAAPGAGALSVEQRESLQAVRRHRLVRRALRYCERGGAGGEAEVEQGLVFLALNASIERQFEYVHRSWLHNEKIGTARGEKDPLMSTGSGERFTLPASPVRRVVQGLPAFVQPRGGGYFFLPSLSALRFLADLPDSAG